MAGPVQQIAGSTSGAGATLGLTLPGTPANGNLLFLFAGYNSTTVTVSSISQTGVTWAALAGSNSHTVRDANWWVGTGVSGASASLTVTWGSSGVSRTATVSEWAGYTSTLDATSVLKTATSTNPTTNSITTVTAATLLLAGLNDSVSAATPTNSFNALSGDSTQIGAKIAAAYREVAATGTYSTGWTAAAGSWDDVLIAVRAAPVVALPDVVMAPFYAN